MNYALIENGVVTNILWIYPHNAHEFPGTVPIDGIPAGIGDTYQDGVFYRDGERVLTHEEAMSNTIADMKAALSILGVSQ